MNEQHKQPDEDGPIIEITDAKEEDVSSDEQSAQTPPPEPPTTSGPSRLSAFWSKLVDMLKLLKVDPQMTIRILDNLIRWARETFPPKRFDAVSDWSVSYGHYGLLAAQVLCLLYGIIAAIESSSISLLFAGIGYALLLVILQYTASKFLGAGSSLLKASPSRLGSAAFLDCLGLLSEITGVLIFLSLLARADLALFFVGLGIWALCDAIAYIALHPEMANVTISQDVGAGEEAIGIMSFLVKATIKIAPIAFGVGTILGSVGILFSLFEVIKTGSTVASIEAIGLVILCACLPFACYVFFALYHLVIDLMRALLSIPRKLDALKNRDA